MCWSGPESNPGPTGAYRSEESKVKTFCIGQGLTLGVKGLKGIITPVKAVNSNDCALGLVPEELLLYA